MASPSGAQAVHVLGPLEVVVDGRPARLRPAQRRLLAILLLDPHAALDRDTIIDRMWGEDMPPTAAAAIGVHLSGIRKAAPGLLVTSGGGYQPDTAAYRLDRVAFEHLAAKAAAEAADGAWDRVLRSVTRAMASWRGTPYPELQDDDFAAADLARLLALWDELTDLHARALLAVARPEEAVVELRELVQRHPLREPLWEHLMLALYRAGRQAEALRAFQEARRVLAEELGVEPGPALRQLEARIVYGDEALGEPAAAAPTNLPVVRSSFVGREDDLGSIAELLATRRLVTIAGGPGLGKTRLAIEAGHAVLDGHPDGVWFVRLAEARSERDVATRIGTAVGLGSQAAGLADLAGRLARRRALLVLDNCEHLVAACADFAGRVLARPGPLRVLATSRRALGLPEEAVWRIAPLSVPAGGDGDATPGSLLESPAVRLFVDRARAGDRGYRLTPDTAPLVRALCRLADGIPLVLELAAAWVPSLGLADIEEMLGADEAPRRGESERPRHQRSLQAALEWSIALLPPEDRELFEAIAVFRGTFGLDDAVGVCPVGGERRRTAAAIGRLVDASLLVADRRDDGRMVYRTLVPVRKFARERLERSPGWERLRRRFVSHYLDKAWGTAPDPFRAVVDLARVDDDLDNLRGAFALGLADGRADEVARAIVPLNGYFLNRMLSREERDWLARALPAVEDPETRARALLSAGLAAQATNELDEALELLSAALAASRALDDAPGIARCLLALAGLHSNRGEWDAGAAAAREGRVLATAQDNASGLGVAAYYLGVNLAYGGSVPEGVDELAEAARLFVDSGELGRASQALSTLTYLGVFTGDERLARRFGREAVTLAERSGSTVRRVRALSATAALEATWGDAALACERLLEVHRLMRAEANEEILELLFPAGCLVRRLERWGLLARLVCFIDDAMAATGQGYADSWRATAASWDHDARASLRELGVEPAAPPAHIETMREEVRRFLEETAAAAG